MKEENRQKAWFNGKIVDIEEIKISPWARGLQYGLGGFEGARCYISLDGKRYIFRLKEHVERLYKSAKVLGLEIQLSKEQIMQGCIDVVKANDFDECYIRPIVYEDAGYHPKVIGLGPVNIKDVQVAILAQPLTAYLGDEAASKGIKVETSVLIKAIEHKLFQSKITANYAWYNLAKTEAMKHGYDEALLKNNSGFALEGSAENVFSVFGGKVYTPQLPGQPILAGITRASIIQILRDMGYEVYETLLTVSDLCRANEVFFVGTAAEIVSVVELDGKEIGDGRQGYVTLKLLKIFFDIIHGRNKKYLNWLTLVK